MQRICLFDTWFSNVFVGRTVATVAEMAFVVQGALVLSFVASQLKSVFGQRVAVAIVGLIALAECFSWYAVITTNYLGNSVEESLWATSYALVGLALFDLGRRSAGSLRLMAGLGSLGSFIYVAFMVTHDVPMYIGRLIEDLHTGRAFFGLTAGVTDLLTRWVVTHDIQEWRTEIPWMSLYFSVAVWLSIALCASPLTVARLHQLQTSREPQ